MSVSIPDSVTSSGVNAFMDCDSMTAITIALKVFPTDRKWGWSPILNASQRHFIYKLSPPFGRAHFLFFASI